MAEWARRRPFYVLGKGPARRWWSAATPTCIALFSDTEDLQVRNAARAPAGNSFNKIMDAQFVTQMDGEQACPCPPAC